MSLRWPLSGRSHRQLGGGRVVGLHPLGKVRPVVRGHDRTLEVRADVVAEGVARESAQRLLAGGGGRDAITAQSVGGEVEADSAKVVVDEGAPARLKGVQQAAGALGQPVQEPVGQPTQDGRQGHQHGSSDSATHRPAAWPRGRHGDAAGGHFACISAARRARASFSSLVDGHIGLKLYHCSGAVAIMSSSASAICCVARCSDAGVESATSIWS